MTLTQQDFESIDTFAATAHENARARGFHDVADRLKALVDGIRNGADLSAFTGDPELAELIIGSYYGNRLLLIVSEVVEAQEEIRHGHAVDEEYEVNGKPEGVISELDDIVIRAGDLIEEIKPGRLGATLAGKMGFNSTRERLHGGKKF